MDKKESTSSTSSATYEEPFLLTRWKKQEKNCSVYNDLLKQPYDNLMEKRKEIIEWLIIMQMQCQLQQRTLFVSIKFFDFYLSKVKVDDSKLQLVATTIMFTCSKIGDTLHVGLENCVTLCENTFTMNDVLEIEKTFVALVNFELNIPTAYDFLEHYFTSTEFSAENKHLAMFAVELSCTNLSLMQFADSKLAAAALYISIYELPSARKRVILQNTTGYARKDISDELKMLDVTFLNALKELSPNIRKKYSSTQFSEIANTVMSVFSSVNSKTSE